MGVGDVFLYLSLICLVAYVAFVIENDDEPPSICKGCHGEYFRSMNSHFCLDEDIPED